MWLIIVAALLGAAFSSNPEGTKGKNIILSLIRINRRLNQEFPLNKITRTDYHFVFEIV